MFLHPLCQVNMALVEALLACAGILEGAFGVIMVRMGAKCLSFCVGFLATWLPRQATITTVGYGVPWLEGWRVGPPEGRARCAMNRIWLGAEMLQEST